MPAYVLIKVLGPGFYARMDTRTPVKFAIIAVIVNVVLNLILMVPLKHVGLALATSLSAWLNMGLLAVTLARRGDLKGDPRLRRRLPRVVAASVVMAIGLWAAIVFLTPTLAAGGGPAMATVAMLVAGGLAVFILLARVSGAISANDLGALLRPDHPTPGNDG